MLTLYIRERYIHIIYRYGGSNVGFKTRINKSVFV